MMPKGGAPARGDQLATLDGIAHGMRTDARVGEWIASAESEDLNEWQRANLQELSREYSEATVLPTSFVERFSRVRTTCETVWRSARGENDFARLIPALSEVVDLVREKAQILSDHNGLSLYDALLDQYDPGTRSAHVDVLFAELQSFLPTLLGDVIERQASQGFIALDGPFAIEDQRELGLSLMKVLGFDFDHGRLDVSAHPFCGGSPDDVRITTRYSTEDFTQSLMGVIHETGHALYELGLPTEWRGQPVGKARGMSMHESQSLLMEMQACRSREFLEYVTPIARERFSGQGAAWSTDNLYKVYTKVQRGLIRVDADEVSYPLHVILRYRLERALLTGDLKVADLPGAWRDGMGELLGVEPPDDRDGCMQDIHWNMGAIGYFPTYTLGAMNAAQLFDAAVSSDDSIMPSISVGDFSPLVTWLRDNVHSQASRYSTDDLMTRATGRPLEVSVFREHLEKRYLA
jgi:carboxypeptidase Taq